jgi:hypothetical protein
LTSRPAERVHAEASAADDADALGNKVLAMVD